MHARGIGSSGTEAVVRTGIAAHATTRATDADRAAMLETLGLKGNPYLP